MKKNPTVKVQAKPSKPIMKSIGDTLKNTFVSKSKQTNLTKEELAMIKERVSVNQPPSSSRKSEIPRFKKPKTAPKKKEAEKPEI